MKLSQKFIIGFIILIVTMSLVLSVQAQVSFLPNITYQVYEGKWEKLPNFNSLAPVKKGTCDKIDVSLSEREDNFGIVFLGNLNVDKTQNYVMQLSSDDGCRVIIDGEVIAEHDGIHAASIQEKVINIKKGIHDFKIEYFEASGGQSLEVKFEPSVLLRYEQITKKHWLYFGWMDDHPKAISLMGGALFPRRPKLPNMDDHSWHFSKEPWHPNASNIIMFLMQVDDGDIFCPDEKAPDRRQRIQWSLANEYLPSPVSIWSKDGIEFRIQHFGEKILNDSVNAVYSRIILTNKEKNNRKVRLLLNGVNVSERCFPLGNFKMKKESDGLMSLEVMLSSNETARYDFISPANGQSSKNALFSAGTFDDRFKEMAKAIDSKIEELTHPTELPDDRLVKLWKSSQPFMWHATVKTPEDYEQRGSGGNVYGFYQYDRVFDHDVPNMVIQYIIEGYWEIAEKIMAGATYERLSKGTLERERYLDAIPKYIITMAQYLLTTGNKDYFTQDILKKIKRCAHVLHDLRIKQLDESLKGKGAYGLLEKSFTLDNGSNHLVVDNFAALHGLVSYEYICQQLGDLQEAKWARAEMIDLNNCLNDAIELSMKQKDSNWYNACFSFDWNERLLSGPGNWFGTTMMMSTFPWNAYLKGFNLDGAWKDHFDSSIEKWLQQSRNFGNPEGSFGAWWSAKYGAIYNTGMGMQLLYSDKYRTKVAQSIEWLLDNMTVPYYWAESFHAPDSKGDWTRPETDLETWGLGFMRQALVQICVSPVVDGSLIIGRGIPDYWLKNGENISWKNLQINDGKKLDMQITRNGKTLEISFDGDSPKGNYLIDIPMCMNNINDVTIEGGRIIKINKKNGKVIVSNDTKKINIKLEG
jgi:hypothetical protein